MCDFPVVVVKLVVVDENDASKVVGDDELYPQVVISSVVYVTVTVPLVVVDVVPAEVIVFVNGGVTSCTINCRSIVVLFPSVEEQLNVRLYRVPLIKFPNPESSILNV